MILSRSVLSNFFLKSLLLHTFVTNLKRFVFRTICPNLAINMISPFISGVLDWSFMTKTMTSKLFWPFLIFAVMAEALSWTRRRQSPSCIRINCVVSSWSSWSACSQPCGTGAVQVRTRTVTADSSCGGSPCPVLLEVRRCNQGKCANGGTPNDGGCNCQQEFSGQCCTQTEGKRHHLWH